jgi:hypothetical protein
VRKRERVKLKWFLVTSGGGIEERVFVKERESLFAKRESEAEVVFSDLWRRG